VISVQVICFSDGFEHLEESQPAEITQL
jgi:hypothetical protein